MHVGWNEQGLQAYLKDGVASGDLRTPCRESRPIKWVHINVLNAYEKRSALQQGIWLAGDKPGVGLDLTTPPTTSEGGNQRREPVPT